MYNIIAKGIALIFKNNNNTIKSVMSRYLILFNLSKLKSRNLKFISLIFETSNNDVIIDNKIRKL